MRPPQGLLASLTLVPLLASLAVGCAHSRKEGGAGAPADAPPPAASAAPAGATPAGADAASAARRIVKKASLELEVASVGDAQVAATRIATLEGGFVASTERTSASGEGNRADGSVTLLLRVPSARFSAALDALRHLGKDSGTERVTTEDVSEEFIDLDARIHNQRELEAQFLEILKRAGRVEDALNVQRELATVRTEIERMEGRRRFLEHETALSTLTVVLAPERPLVRASLSDFSSSVAHAASDTVNLGAGIVTGTIRMLGVLVPVGLLLGLPFALALRLVRRRARRQLVAATAADG